MPTGSDFLGSLLKGAASGARTFGAESMRQQEKADAAAKEAEKINKEYEGQVKFFETLAQNDERYKHHLDFLKEFGQPLSNGQIKTLDEMYGKEQAGADLIYNQLMGTQGRNWSPVAADAGVVPGMLETPTGKADAAKQMLDYAAFRDNSGDLIAPFRRGADIRGMVEQRRAELAQKRNLENIKQETTVREQTKADIADKNEKEKASKAPQLSAKDQDLKDFYFKTYPEQEANQLWNEHITNDRSLDDARSLFKSTLGQVGVIGARPKEIGMAAYTAQYDPFHDRTRGDVMRDIARRLKAGEITQDQAQEQITRTNQFYDNLDYYVEQMYAKNKDGLRDWGKESK